MAGTRRRTIFIECYLQSEGVLDGVGVLAVVCICRGYSRPRSSSWPSPIDYNITGDNVCSEHLDVSGWLGFPFVPPVPLPHEPHGRSGVKRKDEEQKAVSRKEGIVLDKRWGAATFLKGAGIHIITPPFLRLFLVSKQEGVL